VHGPWCYARLNIPNLHTEQIIIQVLTVLKYGTLLLEMMGILLRAAPPLEDMTHEMGLQGELFNMPLEVQHLVTESWIKNIWLACQQYKIQIQMLQHEPNLPCINDIKITHLFLQNSYRADKLRVLNQCCMHLHTLWLSDLSQGWVQTSTNMHGQVRGHVNLPGAGQSLSDQVQGNGECGNKP